MSWWRTAELVGALAARELGGVLGVHVHGATALGGWSPGGPLDVLVVVPDVVPGHRPGDEQLLALAGPLRFLDGPPLDLVVIEESLARRPEPPWRFLLHLAAQSVVLGTATGAGPRTARPERCELVSRLAITRACGITVRGAAPGDLIGQVSPDLIRRRLLDELEWGLHRGTERDVVQDACRAAAWHQDGLFLSQQDGATWARFRLPGHSALIGRILQERHAAMTAPELAGSGRPPGVEAHHLVADVIRLLSGAAGVEAAGVEAAGVEAVPPAVTRPCWGQDQPDLRRKVRCGLAGAV